MHEKFPPEYNNSMGVISECQKNMKVVLCSSKLM